ncbi:MAG: hypothetical protein H7Z75_21535 [Ferruginibacter sp.]|nr:hypothetical protein [Cytophagales bacterium]
MIPLLASLLLVTTRPAVSQVILVEKAYEYVQKKEFGKAREAIDLAAANESTALDARTWYLRGYIYKELYKANPATGGELRAAALEYLGKSAQLDTSLAYRKDGQAVTRYLVVTFYNEASGDLNRQAFDKALTGFRNYLQARSGEPPDNAYATALYYAGYTSLLMGNQSGARQYYEQALRLNYRNSSLYSDLTSIYEAAGQDSLAAGTIRAGRQQFPGDTVLRITEINLLLSQKNYRRVEAIVEEYLALYPANVEVMLVAGTVYERISQGDSLSRESYFNKRKEIYRRVLSTYPDNFSANYNLGITLYNRAVDLIKAQQYDLDIVLLYEILEKVSGLFREAKPYVEKAYRLSPGNLNAMRALEGIYYNLNEKEKSRQIRATINEMK